MVDLKKYLNGNSYPGRGIIVGKTADGTKAVCAYFIMGRSVNSQNRIFSKTDLGIETKAFDESKMEDPSLIIYNPVIFEDGNFIVTNGDQTTTIYNFLKDNKTFEEALATREFEPDPPNFTPRISAMINFANNNCSYKFSILKSDNNRQEHPINYCFNYLSPVSGEGRFIHTYEKDGNPIPSFSGEPVTVCIGDDFNEFTDLVWKNLNEEFKVSLYTAFIDLKTLEVQSTIINKNK